MTLQPQYITNEEGKKISVVLPMAEFERIMEKLDELEDIRLYDDAKKSTEPSMVFDDYVKLRSSN